MARIMMSTPQRSTVEQIFNLYICSVTSEGVKDKTLATYKQHFHAISKRLDVSKPIASLKSYHLDQMIQEMKDNGLSPRSINSYTRTLKVFFSWCNREGYQLFFGTSRFTGTRLRYAAKLSVKETSVKPLA